MSQIVISNEARVALRIYQFRDRQVILDAELAGLFGTTTGRLNQQAKRNADRFGEDFAFRLTGDEFADLISRNVTSSGGHGGLRKAPMVYTEHGAAMAATVLKSPQAAAASRFIINVFIEARRNQLALATGSNVPMVIDAAAVTPNAGAGLLGSLQRGETLIDRALATIVNPRDGTTLRDEGEAIIAEGFGFVKQWLKRPGAEIDQLHANIAKLMAEHDAIRGATPASSAEVRMKQLAATARELRFVLAAERARETGDIDAFMQVLKELGDA